ncbi:MAG: virulence protein RhuM/Fic/DOC family protein [Bacteroidota bacterium]|nr:virulence protein RhuM/Fic/DOC family protein [Bacteroidota bacterium]
MSEILIYKTEDNQTEVEVKFEQDTVWLSQSQITELFQRDRTVITKHINNIFKEGELDEKSNVQKMHIANSDKPVVFYNLDVIISVGYRVKSKRGTQFRQWATQRIKDYLVKGYAINQKRLEQLHQTIQLISAGGKTESLQLQEAKGLLEIIQNYTQSFILLNQFDSNNLATEKLSSSITYEIQYDEAKGAILTLKKQLMKKKEATGLFGNEKDDGFKSSLQSIVQTFGGQYLYPSIEEQAAHLLYFIIKNHSFSDGNKRIGAFLFVWFLEKNRHRFKKSGEVKINDTGLTALALLVAQSKPEEKELMIKLIINLIANK